VWLERVRAYLSRNVVQKLNGVEVVIWDIIGVTYTGLVLYTRSYIGKLIDRKMFIVGVTGGIATGKSTVCDVFREYGIPVIDADVAARKGA
jgi:pantothenate kinase